VNRGDDHGRSGHGGVAALPQRARLATHCPDELSLADQLATCCLQIEPARTIA